MIIKLVIAPLTFVSLAFVACLHGTSYPLCAHGFGEVRRPCVALIVQMKYCYSKCPVNSIDGLQGGMIPRRVSREQKTLFCVCCMDGCSRCSTRAGEVTSAGRSAREPDYCERKRFVLVCEQRGRGCSRENAGRKLLLQTDTGGSPF